MERVERYLVIWAAWYRRDRRHRLGYPTRSLSFSTGGDSARFDDWADREEAKAKAQWARTLDALIEGLSRAEQASLRHGYLNEPWPPYVKSYYVFYDRALAKLEKGINQRGLP